jgi:hypothetical protein
MTYVKLVANKRQNHYLFSFDTAVRLYMSDGDESSSEDDETPEKQYFGDFTYNKFLKAVLKEYLKMKVGDRNEAVPMDTRSNSLYYNEDLWEGYDSMGMNVKGNSGVWRRGFFNSGGTLMYKPAGTDVDRACRTKIFINRHYS